MQKKYLLFNIFYDYLISLGVEEGQIIAIALDDDTTVIYCDLAEFKAAGRNTYYGKYYL